MADFKRTCDAKTLAQLELVERVKKYSVDSLDYKATNNFTTVYDQKNSPSLWVITVCESYSLKPYEWKFPVIGKVSYKGFFKKELARAAVNHFKSLGYDVSLRSVSAWSTLGWLSDPILTNNLNRKKGSLCNLFFHELFHATYYARSSVNFNENIASFIAHKATIKFLQHDGAALDEYLKAEADNNVFSDFMLGQKKWLESYYSGIQTCPAKSILKQKALLQIAERLKNIKKLDSTRYQARRQRILTEKNAYFIDFVQYDSMQDSLEEVFNKFYKGDLKKMVRDLRHTAGNY